jgi:hypothetical protein
MCGNCGGYPSATEITADPTVYIRGWCQRCDLVSKGRHRVFTVDYYRGEHIAATFTYDEPHRIRWVKTYKHFAARVALLIEEGVLQ